MKAMRCNPKGIDRYLKAMESLGFSGAIIVSQGGRVLLRKGYGLADRETRQPYTPSTVQSHGSITKQMTAAAILLLESRGKLSLDDPLATILHGVPDEKRTITLHHLLTHSSGLPGGIGSDDEPIPDEAYVKNAMAQRLEFQPGTEYGYSNVGYALLGIVVERLTGQSYETFLREGLLLPAGMSETGYLLPDWSRDRLAQGYRNGKLWGLEYGRGWLDDGPGWHLRANGGLHTSVDDMMRWLDTVRGQGVLSEKVVQRWTTGYVDEPWGDSQYAYGWVVSNSRWGPMISHSGSNLIFSADFVWLSEPEVFLYIQGNTSIIPARGQRSWLLSAAFDAAFSMPPLVEPYANASPKDAEALEGMYRFKGGMVDLLADDTRLVAKPWGQAALDQMLGHDALRRRQAANLNSRAAEAMGRLEHSEEDALSRIVAEGQDPIAHTRVLLDRISEFGPLKKLHVIGSFENVPTSRFANLGPWTTFVYVELANWKQYWNIIWNSDGTYRETASGPWPSFTLVPTSKKRYMAIRQDPPWNSIELRFENKCIVAEGFQACADS